MDNQDRYERDGKSLKEIDPEAGPSSPTGSRISRLILPGTSSSSPSEPFTPARDSIGSPGN